MKCKKCNYFFVDDLEICPNCGVRVKPRSTIYKIFKVLEVLTVIGCVIFAVIFVLLVLKEWKDKLRKNSYIGSWHLETSERYIKYKDDDVKIILDETLDLKKGNVFYGMGSGGSCYSAVELTERCEGVEPELFLNEKDKIFAITFNTSNGGDVMLCFKNNGKNTIKQVSCEGAGRKMEDGEGIYSLNGGINQEFNIVYKKVR